MWGIAPNCPAVIPPLYVTEPYSTVSVFKRFRFSQSFKPIKVLEYGRVYESKEFIELNLLLRRLKANGVE
jgi:hypothetical protein